MKMKYLPPPLMNLSMMKTMRFCETFFSLGNESKCCQWKTDKLSVYSSNLPDIERDYLSMDKRYPRLYVSPEYSKVVVNWSRENLNVPFNTPIRYQTGALAPLIRWLSQGMRRTATPPQQPRPAVWADNIPAAAGQENQNAPMLGKLLMMTTQTEADRGNFSDFLSPHGRRRPHVTCEDASLRPA